MDVGLIARQIDRRPRGAGGRNREDERRASGREVERRAPFERERKRARARAAAPRAPALPRPGGPAGPPTLASISVAPDSSVHAADAGAQHVAGQVEHAARRVALDAHAQIGAGKHRRHRRDGRASRRPAREIDQAVVFGERQRDRSRRLIRPRRLLRGGGVRRTRRRATAERCHERFNVVMVSSSSRLKVSSTGRASFGGQLGRQKHRRPERGKRHVHRQEPTTVRPPDSFLKRSTSACSRRRPRSSRAGRLCRGRRRRPRAAPRRRTGIASTRNAPGCELDPEARRVVQLEAGSRDRQIERRQIDARPALVRSTPSIRCRYTSSTTKVGASSPARPFSSGSSTASLSASARPDRTSRHLRAPHASNPPAASP